MYPANGKQTGLAPGLNNNRQDAGLWANSTITVIPPDGVYQTLAIWLGVSTAP